MSETALETENTTGNSVPQEDEKSPMSRKRPRLEPTFRIPVLHDSHSLEEAFRKYHAVHIPKIPVAHSENTLKWTDISNLFHSLQKDRQSWCVENGPDVSPSDFFPAGSETTSAYTSFMLQKDTQVLQQTLKRLPIRDFHNTEWSYGPCLWFFFGSNAKGDDLQGRPEHTDSVSHDGTWHYQLSGSKRWYLRPTKELLENVPNATSVCVDCEEGDVLVVNTRLWWHRTVIPCQPNPSVSYARDFYMTPTKATSDNASMSNVDGLYAANDVEEGTIIFTEDDMPDCELPHSTTHPNCEVVDLEDGRQALVSCRKICAGEFFCVAENDASDDDQEDDASFDDQEDVNEES